MSRWDTRVPCSTRNCTGTIEVWLEEIDKGTPIYLFCCSRCDVQGNWVQFARRRLGGRHGTNVRRATY